MKAKQHTLLPYHLNLVHTRSVLIYDVQEEPALHDTLGAGSDCITLAQLLIQLDISC